MVRRGIPWLLALLLSGCPDDFGRGRPSGAVGLVAPVNFAGAANGGSEVVLSWTDRATTETGYRLEMNWGPFGTAIVADVRFAGADTTSLVYETLPNSTYYFRVVAITGTMESDPSDVIVVTTPNVPVRPTGVTAEPLSSGSIRLTWQDVAGEIEYGIQRSADGRPPWSRTAVSAGSTSYTDVGLEPETVYSYRIVARGADGDSTPSEPVLVQTSIASVTIFAHPAVGDAGRFTSNAAAASGEWISHYDAATSDLLLTLRSSGDSFSTFTVDGSLPAFNDVGGDGTSLALDGDGRIHLVAHDRTVQALRYITKAPTSWPAVTIDAAPGFSVGARPRIVFNPIDGALHVVYQSAKQGGGTLLKHAMKPAGLPWSVTSLSSIAVAPTAGHALAIDAAGVLHILFAAAGGSLHYLRKAPTGSTGQLVNIPAEHGPPDFVALAVDGAGALHGFYRGSASKSLHYVTNGAVGLSIQETVHGTVGEDLGSHCSAAVHPATGRIHVAYYDATRKDLRYARKDPGGSWVLKLVDPSGDVGSHVSLAVDATGAVRFAYRDETNRRLKVAVGSP